MDIRKKIKKALSSKYLPIIKGCFALYFSLLLLLITLKLINQNVSFQEKAVEDNPSFYFKPESLQVEPGKEFQVEVKINTGSYQSSGASIQINFEKNLFQVTEVIPGNSISQIPPIFPRILRKITDNYVGKVYLDLGVRINNPQYYLGDGIFTKVKFKVKEDTPEGKYIISFYLPVINNPKTLGDCDIIGTQEKLGQDLLSSVNSLTVNVKKEFPSPSTPDSESNECQEKGGVCCRGDFGCCLNRIGWGYGTTSLGCNPSGNVGGNWCCESCSCH